ncbi:MAG TPA: hypothetical protein ENN30_01465 [Candidatus Woesearchaeota archaeon]|nr:hypothetical protein [Candidatus Woesearchaeota archaeon]
MEEDIKEELCSEIADLLEKAVQAINKKDVTELSNISNELIHYATIHQSKRTMYTAIIIYSISKTLDKIRPEEKLTQFKNKLTALIIFLKSSLEKKDFKRFNKTLKESLKLIAHSDESFSRYIEDVLEFSKAHKGAGIYQHGISLSSVAELLDTSKWELMKKVGETKGTAEKTTVKEIRKRFETAKKLLKNSDTDE